VIGDFGFAKSGVDMTNTRLGTPVTMAPEILESTGSQPYCSKADLWSIGVVYYNMVTGSYPFLGKNVPSLQQDIMRKHDKIFRNKKFNLIEQDLLKRIFVSDPRKRISWNEFFNHEIFKNKKITISPRRPKVTFPMRTISNPTKTKSYSAKKRNSSKRRSDKSIPRSTGSYENHHQVRKYYSNDSKNQIIKINLYKRYLGILN
jgi:serine/threonine protein kinase